LMAVPSANNFGTLLVLAALGSLGGTIAMPAASALAVEEGRKYGMGSTLALYSMAQGIGMAVGPILGGVIADFADINSAFYFGAVMALLGTGLFMWLSK
ncbi:MFS transporter, partial [Chloroflexota bacterium]